MVRSIALFVALILSALSLRAQGLSSAVIEQDTINYTYRPIDQTSTSSEFGLRLYDYMHLTADEPKSANISIVGAPGYSVNTGWRLTLLGNLEYRSPRNWSKINSLQLEATASLTGYYSVALKGANTFGNERHSIAYRAELGSMPRQIYGLDRTTSSGDNYGLYTEKSYYAGAIYRWHTTEQLSLGFGTHYIFEKAKNLDPRALEIIGSRATKYSGAELSILLDFSTHKILDINLQRGIKLHLEATLRPELLNNTSHTLYQADADVNYYVPLWRGALLATDLYAGYQSSNTPWLLRYNLGSEQRMRGYYSSRYTGNALIGAQLELRQRIWEGLVLAAWGGTATIFSHDDIASWHKFLPDYGVGIRWYTTMDQAIRIDLGFGRHGYNFVVGFSEPF